MKRHEVHGKGKKAQDGAIRRPQYGLGGKLGGMDPGIPATELMVDSRFLAELLGVSLRTVQRYPLRGMPVVSRNTYRLVSAVRWLLEQSHREGFEDGRRGQGG